MFPFFVSDLHSRKLQQRLNEKLWLAENYFRTHGGWRSSGPSQISQCSQNPSKSINKALSLTQLSPHTSASALSHDHPAMPTPTARGRSRQKRACPYAQSCLLCLYRHLVFSKPFLWNIRLILNEADWLLVSINRGILFSLIFPLALLHCRSTLQIHGNLMVCCFWLDVTSRVIVSLWYVFLMFRLPFSFWVSAIWREDPVLFMPLD